MHAVVPIIIVLIICIQIFFFVQNFIRMRQFSNIFNDTLSWKLRRNVDTDLVDGVFGNGNSIFTSIVTSINKYLGNNSGSVIDFNLLKDSVDRHCDSVENDISTQTPIPLYWGLAGTMAGVIMGLWDLLQSDAIITLMGSSNEINNSSNNAAVGINSLLSGVAWAMLASIFGILLTTANSLLFKRCKLHQEEGKNSFFAWMQSELLPQLPSDTSQALNNLVRNLNKFNNTFSENISILSNTLNTVNQSYATQADIINAVHEMDVMKMAQANVKVLYELQKCTDKLEVFNTYLNSIEGYTEAIHRFESMFNEQANKIHILQEIRDFFERYKGEIAKTTVDADNALRESLIKIRESTSSNIDDLHAYFISQSEEFKQILKAERDAFEQFTSDLKIQFSDQMTQMPLLAKNLEEIASIPSHIELLIDKVDKSNIRLANDFSQSVKQLLKQSKDNSSSSDEQGYSIHSGHNIPNWMKYSGWSALVIIAISCVLNVVFLFYPVHLINDKTIVSERIEPIKDKNIITESHLIINKDSVTEDSNFVMTELTVKEKNIN